MFFLATFILFILFPGITYGVASDFSNSFQITTKYLSTGEDPLPKARGTARWIPEINLVFSEEEISYDAKASGHFSYLSHITDQSKSKSEKHLAELHRLWLRAANKSTEIRLGLQKINFGSAKILRPLQWFDQINPNDPTKFTSGVKGILLRHYFVNDSNLWAFLLGQNKHLTGPIPLKSSVDHPEFGARFQTPIFGAELGFSAHQRKLTADSNLDGAAEGKFGIDLFIDLGLGLWLEGYQSKFKNFTFKQSHMFTLGVDYTFDIGNGLYTLVEISENLVESEAIVSIVSQKMAKNQLYAVQVSYPLDMVDQVKMLSIDCINCTSKSQIISIQRTLDSWILDLGFFYEKSKTDLSQTNIDKNLNKTSSGLKFAAQLDL